MSNPNDRKRQTKTDEDEDSKSVVQPSQPQSSGSLLKLQHLEVEIPKWKVLLRKAVISVFPGSRVLKAAAKRAAIFNEPEFQHQHGGRRDADQLNLDGHTWKKDKDSRFASRPFGGSIKRLNVFVNKAVIPGTTPSSIARAALGESLSAQTGSIPKIKQNGQGTSQLTSPRINPGGWLSFLDGRFFTCRICKKKFKEHWQMGRHMEHHRKKYYFCRFCCKEFLDVGQYKAHEKSHKSSHKQFKCLVCSKVYECQFSLNDHLTRQEKKNP